MSLFTHASHFIINGGNFTIIHPTQPEDAAATQVLGKRKEWRDDCECVDGHRSRTLDGLMIVKANEFDPLMELSNGNGYRIYPASHNGRFVAVKMFEGPRAKKNWTVDVSFHKEFNLHPNVLRIVGISDENSTKHFILFHGISSNQKMESVIAKSLRTDLDTSALLSMKAVRGIAAGLSYITAENIPIQLRTTNSNQKWENFDIFAGNDNEPIISFHPSNTNPEDNSVLRALNVETDEHGIEILNGLCQQLFSGANSILYDDSPERRFDPYDSREDLPTATLEYAEGTSNSSENETTDSSGNSMGKPRSNRTPRREVWWDPGATDQSLNSIWSCFEKRMNRLLLSSSNSPLRRIRSQKDNYRGRNLHQCPGYLREEIRLTSDMSRSAIVTHTLPNQNELCSICDQLVQYTYSEPDNSPDLSFTDHALPPSLSRGSDPLEPPALDPSDPSSPHTFSSLLSSPSSYTMNSSPPPTQAKGQSQLSKLRKSLAGRISPNQFRALTLDLLKLFPIPKLPTAY